MKIKWTQKTIMFSGHSYYTANSGKYIINLDQRSTGQYCLCVYTYDDGITREAWTENFDVESLQAAKNHAEKILAEKLSEDRTQNEE